MNNFLGYECSLCGRKYTPEEVTYTCYDDGGNLNVLLDYEAIKEPTKEKTALRNRRTVWSINTEGFSGAHFAVFPPELVSLCLLAGSKPDSIVLDPFLGTGTVARSCLEHKRKCVGVELNPDYADIAYERVSTANRGLGL